jgi:hypothetical protein
MARRRSACSSDQTSPTPSSSTTTTPVQNIRERERESGRSNLFRPSPNTERTRRRRGSGGCGTSCGWWPASAPPAAPPLGGPTKRAHDSAHMHDRTRHTHVPASPRGAIFGRREAFAGPADQRFGMSRGRAGADGRDGTRSAYQTDEFVDGDKQPPGILQPQVGLGPACVCVVASQSVHIQRRGHREKGAAAYRASRVSWWSCGPSRRKTSKAKD